METEITLEMINTSKNNRAAAVTLFLAGSGQIKERQTYVKRPKSQSLLVRIIIEVYYLCVGDSPRK